MPQFTYLSGPDDDETTRAFGHSFAAGEWTLIPAGDHHALAKLRANRFFQERDATTESTIPLGASNPNAIADKGTELHEAGNGELPPVCPQPLDITPQQCKAARAGLDWSREQLALAAGIAERTLTDFERQASNMLRKNKVALREAFHRAGVIFDGSNGIRFGESKAA